jgi:hypothetical protein
MRWLTRTLARSGYSSPCTCSHSDLTCLAEDCGGSTVTVATDPSAPMISTGSTVRVVMGWARSASVRRIEPASAQSMHMEHNLPRLLENTCMHFYRQDSKFHERARPKYGRDISLRLDLLIFCCRTDRPVGKRNSSLFQQSPKSRPAYLASLGMLFSWRLQWVSGSCSTGDSTLWCSGCRFRQSPFLRLKPMQITTL